MLFPETITTDRLRLERLCHEMVDVFEYHALCSRQDPAIEEVTEYLPWEPHETVKETHDYIDELESEWEAGTRAEYVIRPKEGAPGAGEAVGAGGLLVDWETRTGRPAIWLRKAFWGNGYSGERAEAMLELAFDRLGLELVQYLSRTATTGPDGPSKRMSRPTAAATTVSSVTRRSGPTVASSTTTGIRSRKHSTAMRPVTRDRDRPNRDGEQRPNFEARPRPLRYVRTR